MHLIKRGNRYSYKRRVPKMVQERDPREHVVVPLKTDSLSVARRLSQQVNQEVEAYWQSLIVSAQPYDHTHYQQVTTLCNQLGFAYHAMHEIATGPIKELVQRMEVVDAVKDDQTAVEAVLGAVEAPKLHVSELLEIYWDISKHKILHKSEAQIRKWRNPRTKAVGNFINICGDKMLESVSRDDIRQVRDWWLDRIEKEGKTPNSANKDVIHLKVIFSDVSDHFKLNLDIDWLFRKMTIRDTQPSTRKPLDDQFIQTTLLDPHYHTEINSEAKYLLYALAETGARPAELVGLVPEDIHLDVEIPYLSIRSNHIRQLKTAYSERDIPLVGVALHAFEQCPNGFEHYRSKKSGADNFSASMNKHLRSKGLLPMVGQSVYSLRHSFQDRLTQHNVLDRIQAQLMGHRFGRPAYGEGANLKQKQEILEQICFKINR